MLVVSTPPPRLVRETGLLAGPALLVHGGAGTYERLRGAEARARLEDGLRTALAAGWHELYRGGTALQAAVEAVACMEDTGLFNAGRGSTPTSGGTIEADAGVMDGGTGAAGAVCAASWPANPVRAALAVAVLGRSCEQEAPAEGDGRPGGGSPPWQPLLLAGAGADRVARAAGLAPREDGTALAPAHGERPGPTGPGTVGAVALDTAGHVAAATSTGGRAGQPPGRIGDSPIIGAGTWADDRTAAISATGTGEAFILAGFAHRVDWAVRSGLSFGDALAAAMAEVGDRGGTGGAIALAPSGHYATIFGTAAMARGRRDATGTVVVI
jgi:isoaspartyl peptidase/L-asparaginase-like protein (Ntn-hydrolase superfamily)